MESTVSFEEIVAAWMLEYDDRFPNDKKERIEAFIVLLGNLEDHGFKKEDITNTRKEKVVRRCVNPNHHKSKLKIWVSMVVQALDSAMLIYYGTVKIRKDVVTPEMIAKIDSIGQKAEESRELHQETPQEELTQDPDAPLNLEADPIDIDLTVRQAVKNPTDQPEFEITDDMLDRMDGPNIVWDVDFNKKLGLE